MSGHKTAAKERLGELFVQALEIAGPEARRPIISSMLTTTEEGHDAIRNDIYRFLHSIGWTLTGTPHEDEYKRYREKATTRSKAISQALKTSYMAQRDGSQPKRGKKPNTTEAMVNAHDHQDHFTDNPGSCDRGPSQFSND